jgi:hypothetical protein
MSVPWILIIRLLWSLNLIASALVIWRLYSLGLHKTYRYFLISMALSVARTAILFPLSPGGDIYRQLWLATQPLVWLSYLLAVTELYRLVLRRYGGIYSPGRWFFFGAVALSIVISGLTVLPALTNERVLPARVLLLYYYSVAERGVITSLAIFFTSAASLCGVVQGPAQQQSLETLLPLFGLLFRKQCNHAVLAGR